MLNGLRRALKRGCLPIARAWAANRRGFSPTDFGMCVDETGSLRMRSFELTELVSRFGTPLFVVDGERLEANAKAFLSLGSVAAVRYSYKTNPIFGILNKLHKLGIGADVISEHELALALRLGVPADRIVFNGPGKSRAALRVAIERGVQLINANSLSELFRISSVAFELGATAAVGLRVILEDCWHGQFGVPAAGDHAHRALERAKQLPNIRLCALHIHRGRQLRTAHEIRQFFDTALKFCEAVRARGVDISVLDLGGSLAVPTVRALSRLEKKLATSMLLPPPAHDRTAVATIETYCSELRSALSRYQERTGHELAIILEPGRALTGDAQLLAASVINVHDSHQGFQYAVLDAGINIAECVTSERHELFLADAPTAEATDTYRIVGPICTPGDVLYPAARLPSLGPGDTLAIMDAGAYFEPFSTAFSFPRPAVVLVGLDNVELIRRAETTSDILARDLFEQAARKKVDSRKANTTESDLARAETPPVLRTSGNP